MAPKNSDLPPEQPMYDEIGWDTERRPHELEDLELHLQNGSMYVPSRMKAEMDSVNGGPVVAVKTKTIVDQMKVIIAPCLTTDPAARKVRTSATLGSAEFGFGIPLRKLGLIVPVGRQLIFPVKKVPNGDKVAYEISFADYANKPRDVDLEALAAEKKAKAEKAKARKAARRAKKDLAPGSDNAQQNG